MKDKKADTPDNFLKGISESVANPSNRDKKLFFWIMSILIIPIFIQIYTLMLMFLATTILGLITKGSTNDTANAIIFPIIIIGSVGCAIGTYWKLWKSYKKNYISNKAL